MGEAIAIAQLLFGGLFLLYWGLAAVCLYLAFAKPKTAKRRAAYAALAVAVFGFYPGKLAYENWEYRRYKQAAFARFKKLCTENAGERIYRVVENVDALFLEKPRARATESELRDQYWMGDPYGYSGLEARDPAGAYLYNRETNAITAKMSAIKGYEYVEIPNANRQRTETKLYVRFHLEWKDIPNERIGKAERMLVPVGEAVSELRSRYGVTWTDISTPQDRKYWIAGGTLTVYDLKDKALLGKRTGYVIDPGFGNSSGGRQIWRNGIYCPQFENQLDRNLEFVAKVLKASSKEALNAR